jgi:hypothetical protein
VIITKQERRSDMKLLTKGTPATPVSIRLEDDEAYARAGAKLQELHGRRAGLEQRRTDLVTGLNRGADRDMLTRRAERLLVDDVVPLPSEVERGAMRRDLDTVNDELTVVRRAIELQQGVLEVEKRRVSATICERLRPQHRAIVRRIAGNLTELVDALAAEKTFREQLNDAGVSYGNDLRPMPMPGLGLFNDPRDPDSTAARWIAEAREFGLLDD